MSKVVVLLSTAALYTAGALWAQTSQTTRTQEEQTTTRTREHHTSGQQSWTGMLVDAACREANPGSACPVTSTTTRFGLVTQEGKFYKLDTQDVSNWQSMVQSAGTEQQVRITGRMRRDTIRVNSMTSGAAPGADRTGRDATGRTTTTTTTTTERTTTQGQTFTGTLYDEDCRAKDPDASCPPSPTTTSFGLMTPDGKFYKLDQESNMKVQSALKSRTSTDEGKVTIQGTLEGDTLKIESIEIK